jgi:hypothetical protein
VRAHPDLARTTIEEQAECRQRRLDPRVVGDAAVFERHVEIRPDEDDLALDVGGLD